MLFDSVKQEVKWAAVPLSVPMATHLISESLIRFTSMERPKVGGLAVKAIEVQFSEAEVKLQKLSELVGECNLKKILQKFLGFLSVVFCYFVGVSLYCF